MRYLSAVARSRSTRLLRDTALALDGTPADVAATESVGPFDLLDRRISAGLRLRCGFAASADVEHTSAVRKNACTIAASASMEDFHALERRRLIQSFDARALGIISRITFRRHHHRKRRVVIPAQIKALKHAVARRD